MKGREKAGCLYLILAKGLMPVLGAWQEHSEREIVCLPSGHHMLWRYLSATIHLR